MSTTFDISNSVLIREQIADLERVKSDLETARGRAITEGQRLAEEAAYGGAHYGRLGLMLAAHRERMDDAFAELIGPINQRIEALNNEIGRVYA